jgi:hypothetical protein
VRPAWLHLPVQRDDYGPLGTELKNNMKSLWWQRVVRERPDVEGIDSAIIAHPRTWEASGHVEHFSDPMVDCRACKKRFRADQLEDAGRADQLEDAGRCREGEGGEHDFTPPRNFNLMLRTHIGASEDAGSIAYLRAETCQPIFNDFKRVREASRQKIPFGIAQIGKAFRNEINPRNFTFRSREFETGRTSACASTATSASTRTTCARGPTAPTSWPTTPGRPWTSNTSSPSAGRRSRGYTIGATGISRATASTPARTWASPIPRPRSTTCPW